MTTLMNRERNGEGVLSRPFGDLWSFDPFRLFAGGAASYGVEINRTDTGYTVEIPVPGYKPNEIEVTLEDGLLTVKGRSEKRNFSRSFTVPEDVDEERIEAQVEHGMLTLVLALTPKAQPKRITVKSSS